MRRVSSRIAVHVLPVISVFVGCSSGGDDNEGNGALDPNAPPVVDGDWYRPTVETTWQWQLQPDAGGEINISHDVDVYDIDLFDVPDETIDALQAAGRRVICYFSAGSYEPFRDDAGEFDAAEIGRPLEGFEEERWLDIRSANVHRIMGARLDRAAARGCDGVEPDNVTGFSNGTGFPLTADDQLAINRFLANEAHARGLSVGLKNDLDQVPDLVAYFDFAVNEQCHEFDECESLRPFIDAGKPVWNAEYADSFVEDADERARICEDSRAANLRTLILPIDLDDSFRFDCDVD
ncbi:MAG: endo alpha-1,4 polygalactosaminidase [Phycisphaerales bacterium]|nr:endo alpha-1,4 polygalactosaminidase [Phycisphaerales bacterium]